MRTFIDWPLHILGKRIEFEDWLPVALIGGFVGFPLIIGMLAWIAGI